MDSTGALDLSDVPGSLLVVGGGYIGLELGTVYAALGTKVSVVEMLPGLLPGADRDLVLPLHKRMEKIFDSIMLNTTVESVKAEAERNSGYALKGLMSRNRKSSSTRFWCRWGASRIRKSQASTKRKSKSDSADSFK